MSAVALDSFDWLFPVLMVCDVCACVWVCVCVSVSVCASTESAWMSACECAGTRLIVTLRSSDEWSDRSFRSVNIKDGGLGNGNFRTELTFVESGSRWERKTGSKLSSSFSPQPSSDSWQPPSKRSRKQSFKVDLLFYHTSTISSPLSLALWLSR